jgi:hypothetical protein
VRRVFIPKTDGRLRPLGVTALEDKIVQRATVEVLNAIYETDFLGFSYGFRPGRSQHQALDALYTGLLTRKVSWVLDLDIRSFFDKLSHSFGMFSSGTGVYSGFLITKDPSLQLTFCSMREGAERDSAWLLTTLRNSLMPERKRGISPTTR